MKVRLITAVAAAALAPAAVAWASGELIVVGPRTTRDAVPWCGAAGGSMRFQCLWLQSDIGHAGYINRVEFDKGNDASGRFNSVRAWLCHTRKDALEATFANNYTGFTPALVLNMRSVTLSGTGWFDLGITTGQFNYNNRNNLLMEIRWNGDDGNDVRCWRSNKPYSRCYAFDHNAAQGTVYNNSQRIRLTIGTAGVAPTSLGRVKTLFE